LQKIAQKYAHPEACQTDHLTVSRRTSIDAMYKVKTVVVDVVVARKCTKELSISFVAEEDHLNSHIVPIYQHQDQFSIHIACNTSGVSPHTSYLVLRNSNAHVARKNSSSDPPSAIFTSCVATFSSLATRTPSCQFHISSSMRSILAFLSPTTPSFLDPRLSIQTLTSFTACSLLTWSQNPSLANVRIFCFPSPLANSSFVVVVVVTTGSVIKYGNVFNSSNGISFG